MPKSSSAASPNWQPWRKDLAKGLTIVLLILAMLCGLFAAGAAPAQAADEDHSEAYSQLLDLDLLTAELAEAGSAHSAFPLSPAPEYNQLDISSLDALALDLGGGLQLPLIGEEGEGLLQLGQLGAAHSYAHTVSPTHARASAGTITEDGAIAIDPSSVAGAPARVDLTMLFEQLNIDGLTNEIIDNAGLNIGAVASHAAINSGAISRDYAVADLTLDLHSPLLASLTGELDTTVDALGAAVEELLDTTGLVSDLVETLGALVDNPIVGISVDGDVLSGVDDALDALSTGIFQAEIESPEYPEDGVEAGLVVLDLTTGAIAINLDALVLNDRNPNTILLNDEVLAQITTAITDTVNVLTAHVRESVITALDQIELDLTISLSVLQLWPLPPLVGLDVEVGGSLADLLGLTDHEITADISGHGLGALLNLLGIGNLVGDIVVPALADVIGGEIGPLVQYLLLGEEALVSQLLSEMSGQLIPILEPLISQLLQVTINEQGATELSGHEAHYVTALSLTLLPLAQAVDLDLATSTVRALDDYADVVITSPEDGEVLWNEEVSVTGTAHPGVDVTVELDGQTTTVTADSSGTWSATFADVSPGDRTVTATDEVTSDTVDFVVRVPVEITSPSEGAEVPGDEVPVAGTAAPNTEVTVTLCLVGEDCPTEGSPTRTTQTDAEGDWSVDFSGVPSGEYTALAADEYDADEVTFSVVYETTLQLDPDTLIPGSTTTVTGGGYAPGEDVVISLPDGEREGEIIPGDEVITTAGEDGSISVELEIPAEYPTGAVEIRAEGPISSTPATATLTVIAPVMITSPEDGEVFSGGTVPVTGTAEPGADVTVTLCARQGDCPEDSPSQIVSVDSGGTWSAEFANVPTGSYTVEATDGVTQDAVDISVPAALQMPLTGGAGQGLYLAVGGVILLLALGLSLAHHRRKGAVHQS